MNKNFNPHKIFQDVLKDMDTVLGGSKTITDALGELIKGIPSEKGRQFLNEAMQSAMKGEKINADELLRKAKIIGDEITAENSK